MQLLQTFEQHAARVEASQSALSEKVDILSAQMDKLERRAQALSEVKLVLNDGGAVPPPNSPDNNDPLYVQDGLVAAEEEPVSEAEEEFPCWQTTIHEPTIDIKEEPSPFLPPSPAPLSPVPVPVPQPAVKPSTGTVKRKFTGQRTKSKPNPLDPKLVLERVKLPPGPMVTRRYQISATDDQVEWLTTKTKITRKDLEELKEVSLFFDTKPLLEALVGMIGLDPYIERKNVQKLVKHSHKTPGILNKECLSLLMDMAKKRGIINPLRRVRKKRAPVNV